MSSRWRIGLAIVLVVGLLSCRTVLGIGEGEAFATPEAAGNALAGALRQGDPEAIKRVLGDAADPLVSSGDPVVDEQQRQRFIRLYDEQYAWISWGEGMAVLEIGADQWPFPIPLLDGNRGWRFDTAVGTEEILNRQVGRNELNTLQACLAFVDAQRDYRALDPQDSAAPGYARFILSEEGKKDGLYWPTAPDEAPSPLGPVYAAARSAGYSPTRGGGKPFQGYLFRILDGQGAAAPGGAYDYLEGDAMLRGFALLAWPAKYGSSGVMTFQVNQLGLIYEKDLGPETGEAATSIELFNPDESWSIVPADDLATPGA
jgi:hypothetical protein